MHTVVHMIEWIMCILVHMIAPRRVLVSHVTSANEEFWRQFRSAADGLGVSYSKALELGARLWLERSTSPVSYGTGAPLFVDPAPVPYETGD